MSSIPVSKTKEHARASLGGGGGAPHARQPVWQRVKPQWLSLILGAVLWEIFGRLEISVVIPPFTSSLMALIDLLSSGELPANYAVSISNFLIGFGMAAVIGVLTGTLMARYRVVEYALDTFIQAGNSAPMLAFIPIFIIIFGLGPAIRIAVAFVFAYWIIVVNTFTGMRSADPSLQEMARSFSASETQLFWKIMLPSSLPLILAGLRLGMTRALEGMINGEMLVTIVGVGAMLMTFGGSFNAPYLFAVILSLIIIALLFNSLARRIERRLAYWERRG